MDNNLDNLTMDQIQEKLKDGNTTFGEMAKIMSVCSQAVRLNQIQEETEKSKLKREKHYKDMKRALYEIKNIIEDVLEDECCECDDEDDEDEDE